MSERATVLPFNREIPLQELTGGLPWVRWLLQSVRARCSHVHFHPAAFRGPDIHARWSQFGAVHFSALTGPRMIRAWHAAASRNLEVLVELDAEISTQMTRAEMERSREAGSVLLRTTRGARYQGVLGHYRNEVHEGNAPGHFLVVWAAVGNFFQISLANLLAEYLRLEWDLGTREFSSVAVPDGAGSFSSLTSAVLLGATAEPALVRREG